MDGIELALTGGFIAIFSTIIGSFAGGATSLIMFPLILFFVTSNYLDALTVNKIAALFMTLAASRIHTRNKKVNLKLFFTLIIFGLVGTAIGTYLVQYNLHEALFKGILAVCLIGMATYIFFAKGKGIHGGNERKIDGFALFIVAIFSIGINILNGLFGGTGMFLTLFFVVFLRMTFISSMIYIMPVYAIINIFQTPYLAYITNIFEKAPLLAISMACCGILGGIIGTKLQYLKGNVWVKRVGIVAMVAIGIKTLFG